MGLYWGFALDFAARGRWHVRRVVVNRGAEVLDEQVAVDARRDPHVAVPHQPLHAVHIDAAAEQLGREGVPEIVEPHRQVDRLGPQLSPARVRHQVAAAVRGLRAGGAEPRLCVARALLVRAPTTGVLVALDDACARQRVPEDLLRVRLAGALLAVGRREDQRPGRTLELQLQPGTQRRRDRQDRRIAALRDVAIVRAADSDGAARQVDVGLSQREELPLAQAERGTAREDRLPVRRDLRQHLAELLRAQRLIDALRDLPARDRVDGIVPDPAAGLLRLGKHGVQLGPQVVERRRRCARGRALVKQLIEVMRAQAGEWDRADVVADDVLLQTDRCAPVAARFRAAVLEPPVAQLAQRAGEFLGADLETAALQPRAALDLRGEFLGLSLRARGDELAGPQTAGADEHHTPAFAVPLDERHRSAPLSGDRYHGREWPRTAASETNDLGGHETETPAKAFRSRELTARRGLVDPRRRASEVCRDLMGLPETIHWERN